MSFRVAVVCEDHTNDQYIVKPIIERMLAEIGRPRAVVKVDTKPQLRGISQVKRHACDILKAYGLISDVVIFALDADGSDGTGDLGDRKEALQRVFRECPENGEKAVVVCASQEIEVWALWGVRDSLGEPWNTVRSHRDPKEAYFDAVLAQENPRRPGAGRARLTAEAMKAGWHSLCQGCPELAVLQAEVSAFL